jgi:hypothetical protein
MFGFEISTLMYWGCGILGFAVASFIWYHIAKWEVNSAVKKLKKTVVAGPSGIDQLEKERLLTEARHNVELQHLLTHIAELNLRRAESEAKVGESMGIIDRLNHTIELMRLDLAAKKVRDAMEAAGESTDPDTYANRG